MKRIISTMTAAGLLAGALMLPPALRAEDKPVEKHEGHGKRGGLDGFAGDMRETFGITEEQEEKLKAARRSKRDKNAAATAELDAATRRLQDQLEDKAPEKDLSVTLDRIRTAKLAMRAEEDRLEASRASILTPTQRAKMILAMKAHMRGGRGGRRGGMRGGMRGEKHGATGKDDGDDD